MSVNTYLRRYTNDESNYIECIRSSESFPSPYRTERRVNCIARSGISKENNQLDPRTLREKALISAESSQRRAKRTLKFLTLNNVTSEWRFLTLTFQGEGVHDREISSRKLQKMIHRLEKHLKKDVKYIAVIELHHTGHGIHYHLLIDIPYFSNEEFAADYWQQGFVKLERLGGKAHTGGLFGAYRYISKYISKGFETSEKSEKRYMSSRNLIREPERKARNWSAQRYGRWTAEALRSGYAIESSWKMKKDDEPEWQGVLLSKRKHHIQGTTLNYNDAPDPWDVDPHDDIDVFIDTNIPTPDLWITPDDPQWGELDDIAF